MNKRLNAILLSKFSLILLLMIAVTNLAASEELISAVVLFRHGDRTPTAECFNKKNYHNWKIGLGELTPLGMKQECANGKLFRDRYINKYKLLPESFDYKSLYVRSTEVNRTLMSALSVLYGLYPPGTGPVLENGKPALEFKYQPIPIHSLLRKNDTLLSQSEFNKKKISEIRKNNVENTDEWKAKESSLKGNFDKWSEIFGKPIKGLNSLKKFASIMYIRRLHSIKLPEGISESDAEMFGKLSGWIHAEQFKPREIGLLTSGNLIESIGKTFKKDSKSEKVEVKLTLYSAHDTNILGAMSALGVPLNKNPPYASYLMFELHKGNLVDIIYNGSQVRLPKIKSTNGLYPLNSFLDYICENEKR